MNIFFIAIVKILVLVTWSCSPPNRPTPNMVIVEPRMVNIFLAHSPNTFKHASLWGSFLNAQLWHMCPIKINNWIRYVYHTDLHTNPHFFSSWMKLRWLLESATVGQVGEGLTKVEGTTWQSLMYRCMISTIDCVNLTKSMARILGSCNILLSHPLGQ